MRKGQSVLEIIIAIAIVVLIAASTVSVVLGSFSSTRLAEEETQASLIAFEGMEAVQSIRNRSWDNLVNGQYGIDSSSGEWDFSGTSDTDPSGKFTRVITIGDINRDLNGDIVSGNGILDEDSKNVTATVTWDFTPARQNTVEFNSILTNWQLAVDPGTATNEVTTCSEFCQGSAYTDGLCRNNPNQCVDGVEVHESGGDHYCIQNPTKSCCCQI